MRNLQKKLVQNSKVMLKQLELSKITNSKLIKSLK